MTNELLRRTFMFGGAANIAFGSVANADTHQRPVFKNGTLDAEGTLNWSNGGGDSLKAHLRADGFRKTLALPRLNFEPGLQRKIRKRISRPGERIDLRMYEGQTIQGVMVSGNGWLAMRPRVLTSRWSRRTFGATSWFVTYTNSSGRIERWNIIIADVCGNFIARPLGGPLPCVCDPAKDACGIYA